MDAPHVYVRARALGCFHSLISTRTFRRALTASVDSCAEIECLFNGVTKSGRVWRKVPESEARSALALARAQDIERLSHSGAQRRAMTTTHPSKLWMDPPPPAPPPSHPGRTVRVYQPTGSKLTETTVGSRGRDWKQNRGLKVLFFGETVLWLHLYQLRLFRGSEECGCF